MRKIFLIFSILTLSVSFQALSLNLKPSKKRYITPEEVHVTVSPAARQKANALYESVRKAYSQGKLSPDAVVDKALYHKTWSPELAERCLLLVSDKNARAKAELGYLYTFYKTAHLFPGKEAQGVSLMEDSANSGYKKASDYLGIYYNRKKDYNKAWKYFKAAGPDNIPFALTVMGEMYEDGKGVKKDRPTAREYFRRAASLGDADGAFKYGAALSRQWYGKVDMPDAFLWTYVAGELGNDFARSNLLLPIRGERFGDDKNTAFMRNAMTLGDTWNENFGNKLKDEPIYQEGYKIGLPVRAVAAEKGDPLSLFYLGSMSYNDEFLDHKDEFISECYTPLISKDNLPSPFMALVYERMAQIYSNGKGVKHDAAKAARYNRKAADLGSLAAYKIIENIPE